MTEYQLHCQRWKDGCGAAECSMEGVQRVFGRGSLPCDVLFAGEAPGESENALQTPFIGPAGKLLDVIIEQAKWALPVIPVPGLPKGRDWCWAMTNIVACIPRLEGGGYDQPNDEQIRACQPRLAEFIKLADPKILVTVGKVAADWIDNERDAYRHALKPSEGIRLVKMDHPSRILRMSQAQQGLAVQRCVVTLVTAIREVFGTK